MAKPPSDIQVVLKAGTVLVEDLHPNRSSRGEKPKKLKFDEPTKVTLLNSGSYGRTYDAPTLVEGWHHYVPDPSTYDVLPALKPVSKEFRTFAVTGSEWEVKEDWWFQGHYNFVRYDIPKGTKFIVARAKMSQSYHNNGLLIHVKVTPEVAKIFKIDANAQKELALPAKEFAHHVTLSKPGKTKTYWCIEDKDGKRVVDKRFADLGKVKASVRTRLNMVRFDPNNVPLTSGGSVPYWIEGDDSYEAQSMGDGWWAVEYDYATNKELQREDLMQYAVMAKLKA